jgi:hypothetical protein
MREERAQIGLERLLGDRSRLDRHLEHVLRKPGRIAVGRRRDDQVLAWREEHARRILQQLLRPDAQDHVLALRGVEPRDQNLEIRVQRCAVERIPIGLGKLAEDSVDRGFPGTERVFIAADANAFHSRRKIGTHATRATLAAGLLRFRHQLFVAAGGHESSGMGVLSQSQALKETAARHRHGIPPSAVRG